MINEPSIPTFQGESQEFDSAFKIAHALKERSVYDEDLVILLGKDDETKAFLKSWTSEGAKPIQKAATHIRELEIFNGASILADDKKAPFLHPTVQLRLFVSEPTTIKMVMRSGP
jgi:hypothetical protein